MSLSSAVQGIRGSVVARNAGSLFFVQAATYLLPLLLIPYLTGVLGVERYGVFAFGLAVVQIICVLTDYGFNLSVTYRIACERDDRYVVGELVGAVLSCKTIILLLLCIGVVLYVLLIPGDGHWQREFLLLMLLSAVGQTYQPVWFFQGMERMAFITLCTLASRVLFVVSVLLFVRAPGDLNNVAIANGVSNLTAAILGTVMMLRMGYRSRWPGWREVRKVFSDSTQYFWSRAAVMVYTAGSTFFLGLAGTPAHVAHYSAAEQLYRGAQSLYGALPQAMYPNMAREKNYSLFRRVLFGVVGLGIAGVVLGAILGPKIIDLLYGEEFKDSYSVLIVFLVTFAVVAPSMMLGYPFLGALGRADLANRTVMLAACLQIAILFILYFFGVATALNVALSVLATEVAVLVLRAIPARRMYSELSLAINKS